MALERGCSVLASIAFGCAVVAGCETTPTEVLVHFDADPELAAVGKTLSVVVRDDGARIVVDRTVEIGASAPATWPFTVPLVPRGGDASRSFDIEGTLKDAAGAVLGVQRARGGYVTDMLLEIFLRFDLACRGRVECPSSETCRCGACIDSYASGVPRGASPPRTCGDVPDGGACGACASTAIDGTCQPVSDGTACGAGACWGGSCCEGCWSWVSLACEPGDALEGCGASGAPCATCACLDGACLEGRCASVLHPTAIDAADAHSCAVDATGRLFCWGSAISGRLGVGSTGSYVNAPREVLAPIGTPGVWDIVATGAVHTCATRTDQSLLCWGAASYGQIGIGISSGSRSTPQPVTGTGYADVSAGAQHTCAVRTNGTLWCWGRGSDGQLGNNATPTTQPTPLHIGVDTTWAAISCGDAHSCALRRDASLWCWGDNADGQLGEGSTRDALVPTRVMAGMGAQFSAVSCGSHHTCAIRIDSGAPEIWCWGRNDFGQLGIGLAGADVVLPTRIAWSVVPERVSAGTDFTCAVSGDHALWCWGWNSIGQLGIGSPTEVGTQRNEPARVGGATDWRVLAAGGSHACAARAEGALWCWGSNISGRLGIGSDVAVPPPAPLPVCASPL